jgi:hypothetical protein
MPRFVDAKDASARTLKLYSKIKKQEHDDGNNKSQNEFKPLMRQNT